MGKKSTKKKDVKNKSNRKQTQSKKDIQNKIEQQQEIKRLLEEKHTTSKIRIWNFTDIVWDVVKAVWAVILGFATLGIAVFLVWAGIAYMKGNSNLANLTMAVMQALTGVVSVIVGIWALYLTIKQTRKETANKERLNIVVSPTTSKVIGVPNESDVNPESIG